MSIKRYAAHTNIDDFKSDWHESKDGPTVKYSDYSALEQQLTALTSQLESVVAENAALKAFGDKLDEMHNDLNGEGTGIQGRAEVACQQVALEAAMEEFDAIKTPATDAFLAEVRASAIPADVMVAIKKVARIRLDLNDFDGDKRGIIDCLSEAEESLVEVVNKFAAQIREEAK